ncbi:MAG: tryptophan--tRNA ligase [Candidatus Omnitrophica bacterium]|nr:tryptophan--tRNA ligase [Candidatus Omnitrophota bacterium]MCM8790861.1 tryptophan--tRNA ligase [Candidatus Omnitrophota bacterium]
MTSKKRVLSGMRPTGRLHLGHLVGALNNWVKLQQEYQCFYMIADWHALMSEYEDPKGMAENSIEMAMDFIAAGIDPDKSVLFVQSHVPEHLELAMVFSDITPLGWVERCPTYKEQLREIKGRDLTTYGFLGYPILQAADIALYKANAVPVGVDQLPHLELTREIVRRFNALYGKAIFPEPEPLLTKTPKLAGLDNRKMSKSYGNFIALSDKPHEIEKKVSQMITDPARIKLKDKGHPEVCNVFSYYAIFAEPHLLDNVRDWCEGAKLGCTECKKSLAKILVGYLEPMRQKRANISEEDVRDILKEGAKKASRAAAETMAQVRSLIHFVQIS